MHPTTHEEADDIEETFRTRVVKRGESLLIPGVWVDLGVLDEVSDNGEVTLERCLVKSGLRKQQGKNDFNRSAVSSKRDEQGIQRTTRTSPSASSIPLTAPPSAMRNWTMDR